MRPPFSLRIGPLSDEQQRAVTATRGSGFVSRASRDWREAVDAIVVLGALEIDDQRMMRIDADSRDLLDQIVGACRRGGVACCLVDQDDQTLAAWAPAARPSAKGRTMPIDEALAARRG